MLTPEQIERMAREHGIDATRLSTVVCFASAIERAVVDATIERCAKVCQARAQRATTLGRQFEAIACIEDIRALKQREGS